MPIIKKAPAIVTREVKTRRARQPTARRLRAIHRKQRRTTSSTPSLRKSLAGPGLPQVARARRAAQPGSDKGRRPKREGAA